MDFKHPYALNLSRTSAITVTSALIQSNISFSCDVIMGPLGIGFDVTVEHSDACQLDTIYAESKAQ